MKKSIYLVLDEDQIIELYRILIDNDAEGALIFLKRQIKGKMHELLEGG